MDFDCEGIWSSWINPPAGSTVPTLPFPPSDGLIQVELEDSAGNFQGTHFNSGRRIQGQCKLNPHHIMFTRMDGGTTYIYKGRIDPDPLTGVLVAIGKVRTIGGEGVEIALAADDDWTGVKTT